ncbi:MAG: MiaB/RimO family radical SAM methylthiotransferase [Candidatus Hydrogenedentota bacterium]|nr:MAG: MiaB/RimO family radical SAM methylthiotransferase [Candidatus Hydrogenedentota bacterium]
MKKFYIETLGCPKNEVDSKRMKLAMIKEGFLPSENPEEADFILINSCSFIQEAQEETIDTIFSAIDIKEQKNKNAKIGVIGCFTERFHKHIEKEIPEIDFLVGTNRYEEVPVLLKEKFRLNGTLTKKSRKTIPLQEGQKPYSHFRIARGCSRSCAFCILPTIRGSLNPYSFSQIQNEWEKEIQLRGGNIPKEVILISQDTISQGVENLREIVQFFSAIPEVQWIRFQYLFPDKRVLKLLDLWNEFDKLVPYLDIPFQHAHPAVLRRMNRPDQPDLFFEIIEKARGIRPDMEIRTSFIVGFPDETEEEFSALKTFIEQAEIDKLALFRYSHEDGTPAAKQYVDNIDDHTKIRRMNELNSFFLEHRRKKREGLMGKIEKMMLESITETEWDFRRAQDAPEIDEIVHVSPVKGINVKEGEFYPVRIESPLEIDWEGTWVM